MNSFMHFGSGLVLLACAALACGDDTTGTGGSGATGGNGGTPDQGGTPAVGGFSSNGGGGEGTGGTPATGGGGAGQGGMAAGGGGTGGGSGECFFYKDCDPTLADDCQCLGCGASNECTDETDCVCPQCANNEFCQADACVDDGQCDPYLEGCVCADCADQAPCL